ncbi:hypothetical protein KC353_g42 [Hortaea werneckii]|nr:hypothetical protein KC353_g42 [Hortaea werneckii]
MSRLLRFLQLNVQKQRNVQHSLMNDLNLKEYAALMISEPHFGLPSCPAKGTTGGGRSVACFGCAETSNIDQCWWHQYVLKRRTPRRTAPRLGEADPIIDFMGEWSLESLLPRGTKTWQDSRYATTIDLMLVSQELAASVLKCKIHDTEHGSDHRAIETTLDVDLLEHVVEPRLLYKNAPWKEIRERIARTLQQQRRGVTVQEQIDRLMHAVQEAVFALTPKAKPCPYAKRWWTQDLSKLRRVYTYWRNRARAQRRGGEALPMLEQQARAASKEYHDAIHRQQQTHWDDFLADDANTWKATRYLQPDQGSSWSRIPLLSRADGSLTRNTAEQAEQLIATFFPPLPEDIEEEGDRPQRTAFTMPQLTEEEIESCLTKTKPCKAAGEDVSTAPTLRTLVHTAGPASSAGHRTMNTWKHSFKEPAKR